MTKEKDQIQREQAVQGSRWNSMHGGYFGDPAVARPLLAAIARAAAQSPPMVLADLGGGTGFLLEQVLSLCQAPGAVLVNVDLSPRQLDQCRSGQITELNRSASEVTRRDLHAGAGRLMFVMRSLLHYFGREGLGPFLEHLRAQMKPGEILVHQTACFTDPRDADCLNRLYGRMRTGKWYPTRQELRDRMEQAGWSVSGEDPAPPLLLTSADLAERYQLTPADIAAILRELTERFGHVPEVFEPSASGFTAFLHYQILTCVAR